MRSEGIWHPRLIELITSMGHFDTLVIADAGLPVPPDVEVIDLVWREGDPRFLPVLSAVIAELVVESAIVAEEMAEKAPELLDAVGKLLCDKPITFVSHEDFKLKTRAATAIVRTGEVTPYANIILRAGVPF